MRRLILLSLSFLTLTSCATPSADRPDSSVAAAPCPPSLQAPIPDEPQLAAGASIVKAPPGSKAAAATAKFLGWVAADGDWAGLMLERVKTAKTYCDGRP